MTRETTLHPSRPIYVVLMHYPIVNRQGKLVTTSVTNMDIHDIARSARTFGASGYFLVTPIEDQHQLVGRILGHWRQDSSREWHPDRFEALSRVQMARDFEEVKSLVRAECGGRDPVVAMPDARPLPNAVSYADFRRELEDPAQAGVPVCVVFGTGWGISETFFPEVHRILAPVYGPEGRGITTSRFARRQLLFPDHGLGQ